MLTENIQAQKRNMLVDARSIKQVSLSFDESTQAHYGVNFLQRINTPKGLATVMGENEGNLWFWLDNESGVSFWDNFDRLNSGNTVEFSLSKDENYPRQVVEYISKQFKIEFDLIVRLEKMNDDERRAFELVQVLGKEHVELEALLKHANIFTPNNLDAVLKHPEKKSIIGLLDFLFLSNPTHQQLLPSNVEFDVIVNHPSLKEIFPTLTLLKNLNLYNQENILSLLIVGTLPSQTQEILEKYLPVQYRIKENGALFGNKAANLIELDTLFKKEKNNFIDVQVPEIFPIDDASIHNHLDTHAPDWRNLWEQFVQAQKERDTLRPDSVAKLRELQSLIIDCFKKNTFDSAIVQSIHLPVDTLFMVRSTGDEDKIDLANPGGNKSVAAVKLDPNAFSEAIGTVVASYFGEKSLTQRLLSSDDITKTPFIPVLIQKMIGEKLNGNDPDQIVVSGVMYAKDSMTRIDVAPGHGELIVNSKAPFDTYDVTAEQIVHAEIYSKQTRLVPVEQQDAKRKLIFKDNPKTVKESPSLAPAIAKEIAEVGQKIAEHYGFPVDIEFVYEPHNKILYLVQTRPIKQAVILNIKPSSIAPEHWAQIKQDPDVKKLKVKVVSPAGDAIRIITDRDQILFRKNIGKALKYYLDHPEIQNKIRAIVIEEDAPSTSHEAAQFNALSLPVVQANKKLVKAWLKERNPVVIVDPQRHYLVNWTMRIKDHNNAEQELRDDKIVVPGLFSSSLNPKKTLLPINDQFPKIIGEIIQKYLKNSEQKIDKDHIYKDLMQCFEVIESAKPNAENKEAFQALQKVADIFKAIGTSTHAKDNHSSHKQIFLHAMFSIAEIDQCLEKYSAYSVEGTSKELQQHHLLDLVSKLKALTVNPGEKDLYSDSIMQIARNNKAFIAVKSNKELTQYQRKYFQEFLKLNTLALRQDTREQWTQFAGYCSQSLRSRQYLARIIMQISRYHLESELINELFTRHLNNAKNRNLSYKTILMDIYKEVTNSEEQFKQAHFIETNNLIASWEKRIQEWSNPGKFDHLFEGFQRDIVPLIRKISINDAMPNLTKKAVLKQAQVLTELIDKTIKSMKGSPEYTKDQTSLVIERFIKLLNPYFDLMWAWMDKIPEKQYRKWALKITKDDYYNNKKPMMDEISSAFRNKTKQLLDNTNELHPSGYISIAAVRVGTTASFERQMVENDNKLTLEDLFSLFHQNILASLVVLGKDLEIPIENLPEPLQPLLQTLQNNHAISLLGIRHEPPKICLEYNIPLDNHSAKLMVEYNTETQNFILHGNIFGKNWENRMGLICRIAEMDGLFLNSKILQEPVYNAQNFSLDFSWQFEGNQIDRLVKNVNQIISHYSDLTEKIDEEEAFKRMLGRYLKYETSDQVEKSLSPVNLNLLKNKIQSIPNHLILDLILAFPELIDLCDKNFLNLNDASSVVFDHLENINFENLLKLMDKVKVDLNYKGLYGKTLFKKILENLHSDDVIRLIKKYNPDLSREVYSVAESNIELIDLLLEHGMPFANFNFDFKSIVPFMKDTRFKSIVGKEIAAWDRVKLSGFLTVSVAQCHGLSDELIELFDLLASKLDLNHPQEDVCIYTPFELMLKGCEWSLDRFKEFSAQYDIDYKQQKYAISLALQSSKPDIAEWLLEKGAPSDNIEEKAYKAGIKLLKGREILTKCFNTFSPEKLTEEMYSKYYPSPSSSSETYEFYHQILEQFGKVLNFNFRLNASQRSSLDMSFFDRSFFEKLMELPHHIDYLKKIVADNQLDFAQHPNAIYMACSREELDLAMLLAQKKAKKFALSGRDMNAIFKASNIENCLSLIKDWSEKELYSWIIVDQGKNLDPVILRALLSKLNPESSSSKLQNAAGNPTNPKLDTFKDKFRFIFSTTVLSPLLSNLKIWNLGFGTSTHIEFLDCPDSLTAEQKAIAVDFFVKLGLSPWRIVVSSKYNGDDSRHHKPQLELFFPKEKLEELLTNYIANQRNNQVATTQTQLINNLGLFKPKALDQFKPKALDQLGVRQNITETPKPKSR